MKTREPWQDFLREIDQWSSKLSNPKNVLKNKYYHSITHIFQGKNKRPSLGGNEKRIAHKIEISWTIFLPEIASESQLILKMKGA